MKTEQNGLKLTIEFESSKALQDFLGNAPIESLKEQMSGDLMAFEKDGWVCIDTSKLQFGTEDLELIFQKAKSQIQWDVFELQSINGEMQQRQAQRLANKTKWMDEVLCCLDPYNCKED